MNKLCVISISGGLDSTTLAYKALEDGYDILPINIEYGQKNTVERKAFDNVLFEINRDFPDRIVDVVYLDLSKIAETTFETYKKIRDSSKVKETTSMEFYTPSRNLVFSTLAAMIGEITAMASSRTEICVGLGVHRHSSDVYEKGDYWDITPEFVIRLNHLFSLNDCMRVKMYSPYVNKFKNEIVKDAIRLHVPYKLTWTCYNPQYSSETKNIAKPCLECEACRERQKAGNDAKVEDINDYQIKL